MTEEEWDRNPGQEEVLVAVFQRSTERRLALYLLAAYAVDLPIVYDGEVRLDYELLMDHVDKPVAEERLREARDRCYHSEYESMLTCEVSSVCADLSDLFLGIITWSEFIRVVALHTTCKGIEQGALDPLLRDIFGNPFRPVTFAPEWRTEAAVGIASQMYDSRDFGNMPILADALQDAGCEHADILAHCREPGTHVRGCWVVDLVLGKE